MSLNNQPQHHQFYYEVYCFPKERKILVDYLSVSLFFRKNVVFKIYLKTIKADLMYLLNRNGSKIPRHNHSSPSILNSVGALGIVFPKKSIVPPKPATIFTPLSSRKVLFFSIHNSCLGAPKQTARTSGRFFLIKRARSSYSSMAIGVGNIGENALNTSEGYFD